MQTSADKDRRFELLVLEHNVRIRAFVRSMGVDPDWVDDIAQEAFIKAYRDWDSFDTSRDFGRWLRGIAANIVRNEIRKQTRRQGILHSELAELLWERHRESTSRTEPVAVELVRECLGKLSPASKRIIQGRYRDGLLATELAEKLRTSAAGVRQALVRIRREIRSCIERHMASEA
jgi:RNA polymerase sigma-70 factor (ECF subfamily)